MTPAHPPEDSRSDPSLVEALNAGEVAAFEALYRRYRDWVVNLAFRFTRDRELALDVLQDTFLYVLKKFPGFELHSNMKTFLYPVVRNLAISAQSRSRRVSMGEESTRRLAARSDPEAAERRRQLAEVVNRLPPGQREVLILRFVDDLPLAAIATALGVPIGTVKSRLHAALEGLRRDDVTKKYFEP